MGVNDGMVAYLGIMTRCMLTTLALAVVQGLGLLPAAAGESRYVAVFVDGSRAEGNEINGWSYEHDSPRLDGTELLEPRPAAALAPRSDGPGRHARSGRAGRVHQRRPPAGPRAGTD